MDKFPSIWSLDKSSVKECTFYAFLDDVQVDESLFQEMDDLDLEDLDLQDD